MNYSLKSKIFNFATRELGFDDCKFTDPFLGDSLDVYRQWLDDDHHGDMKYLEEHLKFKENPELLLNNTRSAIVVIKNYKNISQRKLNGNFKVARYAAGKDYHLVISKRLQKLEEFLKIQIPAIETYSGVDSRPIAERSLALSAGIGFLGKNSMVIKPGLGSYFFIGVILTTYEFANDKPLKWNCGTCRLCIDACPTNAILENFSLAAQKCISYQTIERKAPLSGEEISKTNGWLFGCDICQEVCPYNHENIPLTNWPEFLPEAGVGFDFFTKAGEKGEFKIPKETPLYRSRNCLLSNWQASLQKSPLTKS